MGWRMAGPGYGWMDGHDGDGSLLACASEHTTRDGDDDDDDFFFFAFRRSVWFGVFLRRSGSFLSATGGFGTDGLEKDMFFFSFPSSDCAATLGIHGLGHACMGHTRVGRRDTRLGDTPCIFGFVFCVLFIFFFSPCSLLLLARLGG